MENNFGQSANTQMASFTEDKVLNWNHNMWLSLFRTASIDKDSFKLHILRTEVFHSTVSVVNRGCYYSETGTLVFPRFNENIRLESKFYSDVFDVHGHREYYDTRVYAVEDDCLAYARRFADSEEGVCVLNMANRRNPGGGVFNGAGAQEEYLFRCSDYYRSLFQYIEYSGLYGIEHSDRSYPLDRNYGGIFSRGVTVFRGREEDGYPLLDKPWRVNMIAVPAMSNPRTISLGGELRLAPDLIEGVKNKIRTILRIAAINGQKTLILGALGCGAFHNPPRHTAELFKEVINEPEFKNIFKTICFAIKEDHNSPDGGNYKPFAEIFGTY